MYAGQGRNHLEFDVFPVSVSSFDTLFLFNFSVFTHARWVTLCRIDSLLQTHPALLTFTHYCTYEGSIVLFSVTVTFFFIAFILKCISYNSTISFVFLFTFILSIPMPRYSSSRLVTSPPLFTRSCSDVWNFYVDKKSDCYVICENSTRYQCFLLIFVVIIITTA